MKKIFFFFAIGFMVFTFIACGNPYMGKIVKKDMTRAITTPSGKNHHYVLNHIIVDYNYTRFPEQALIVIKGTIDDRQQDAQAHLVQGGGWTLKEAYLDIYFENSERRVVDFCRKAFPAGHFSFPYPFTAKCRYSPDYRYAALSYRYKYIQYEGGSSEVVKMYEHKLDIE
ncbi:MAG: hypothetical protein MUP22_03865 [Desulfobacterales bacterium]|nr:hypothetical protein [Desulfobacterales bacterium]